MLIVAWRRFGFLADVRELCKDWSDCGDAQADLSMLATHVI